MQSTTLNILIHTGFDDQHAVIVEAALRERGHRVLRHFGSDLPLTSSLDMRFADARSEHTLYCLDGEFAIGDFDVVWNRRPQRPVLPTGIAEADRGFVRRENERFELGFYHLLEDAFWANPHRAAIEANIKPWQLKQAVRAGLRVPPTLISNRPEAICGFLRSHARAIYKPLQGMVWYENGKEFGSYTARVCVGDLPEERLLRAAPGIYQAQIPKQYEVRAQFFGASCFAAAIDSNRIEYGEFDWRLHQDTKISSGAVQLPETVRAACVTLMRRLGLVCGAFDFIVTPDDEWIFLEVNEAGQFLFLEQWAPDLPVVDAFCAFLESRDPNFKYRSPASPRRWAELAGDYAFADLLNADRVRRQVVESTLCAQAVA